MQDKMDYKIKHIYWNAKEIIILDWNNKHKCIYSTLNVALRILSLYDRLFGENIELLPLITKWPLLGKQEENHMCETVPAIMSSCSHSLWFPVLVSGLPRPQNQERWFLGGFWKHITVAASLFGTEPLCLFSICPTAVPCFYGQVTIVEAMVSFLGVIHRIYW